MRVVFMGTPLFAETVLERVAQEFDVVGVFTQPDAVRSRGKELDPTAVKRYATQQGLPVFEYETFKDNDALDVLKDLAPDVICVAAYGVLLPQVVLDMPKFGCLNVHPSILPRWRGAAPIERAVLEDDDELGVCIMKMDAGLDTGDFCLVETIPNGGRTARDLRPELAAIGANLMVEALHQLEAGTLEWTVQDESQASYADKIEKGELNVFPHENVRGAWRCVQASNDSFQSKCVIGGKDVSLYRAALPKLQTAELQAMRPGQVLFFLKKLYLGFADGALEILELKPAGKKLMPARDFAAGLQGIKEGNVTWDAYGE